MFVGFQGDRPVLLGATAEQVNAHPVVRCDRVEEAARAELLPDGRIYLGDAIEAATARIAAEARIEELQAYLRETDWYAIRLADNGTPVPDEVKNARQQAREEIDSLRGV